MNKCLSGALVKPKYAVLQTLWITASRLLFFNVLSMHIFTSVMCMKLTQERTEELWQKNMLCDLYKIK